MLCGVGWKYKLVKGGFDEVETGCVPTPEGMTRGIQEVMDIDTNRS